MSENTLGNVKKQVEEKEKLGFLDKVLAKVWSRKLSVFIISCVFLSLEKIEPAQWTNLAIIYIGSQAVLDMIIRLRQNK